MDKAVPIRGERGQKGECSVLTGTEGASHDQTKQEKMSSWVSVQLHTISSPCDFCALDKPYLFTDLHK